jgi:hypothetical protein
MALNPALVPTVPGANPPAVNSPLSGDYGKFATGLVGASFTIHHDTAKFELGTVTFGSDNSTMRYVKAKVALPAGPCAVNAANEASSGAGFAAPVPFELVAPFGWVEVTGGAT